jgi:hypothetical protein
MTLTVFHKVHFFMNIFLGPLPYISPPYTMCLLRVGLLKSDLVICVRFSTVALSSVIRVFLRILLSGSPSIIYMRNHSKFRDETNYVIYRAIATINDVLI